MMTNVQLYLAVGIPMLAILASMALSLIQISNIRGEIKELRQDMRDLRKEMLEVRRDMQDLRNEVNTKIDLLTSKVYELMSRN